MHRLPPIALVPACAAVFLVSLGAGTAATITNASFESTVFTDWPGYISEPLNVGVGLPGWTASNTARAGLNARPNTWAAGTGGTGDGPFANNGVIPAGNQAAFLQATNAAGSTVTTLSTNVTGLAVGQDYRITFRVTSRNNGVAANQRPNGTVSIAGTSVNFQVDPLEAANTFTQAYRTVAIVFKATGVTETLTLTNTNTNAGTGQTDATLVMDDFQIATGATKWVTTAWTDDGTSGVSPGVYTYSHAYNLGSATGSTVNGVNFTGIGAVNPSDAGKFSTTGYTALAADAANNVIAAGGGSGGLANAFVYGGSTQSITLTGLTPGTNNRLTLFAMGWTEAASGVARAFTASDGNGDVMTLNEHTFGLDNGVKFTFDYVPAGTSQTFTFVPTSSASTMHLYAFSNGFIPTPEPSTALLGVLGLAGAWRRRR